MEKQSFLNTHLNNLTLQETIDKICSIIDNEQQGAYVAPINVDVIVKMEQDGYLRDIVTKADITVADGKPLIWISKLQKQPLKEKVSGSDLVPALCEVAAQKGYSLFILGGMPGVAEKAALRLIEKHSSLRIAGTYAPPVGYEKNPAEISKINQMILHSNVDILMVCLGCPKQEKFIYENKEMYHAKVSICAGATVDFLAGNVKRCPKWMSEHGMEWIFRFFQEPKRLFRRYFIEDLRIIGLVLKYKNKK